MAIHDIEQGGLIFQDIVSRYFQTELAIIWYRPCSVLLKSHCVSYFCEGCLQELERALLMKPFPYNHSISDVSAWGGGGGHS